MSKKHAVVNKGEEQAMTMLGGKLLRHEYKYEIDPMQYQVLKKKVALLLKPDPFTGPEGGYNIRNLYFDDFRNTALYEKNAGVYLRKKYRMRIYDHNDSKIKFERKTKLGEYILKEDVKLTREEADRIIAGDFGFLVDSKNHLLRTFYIESRQNLIRPVVIVEYYREAFYDPVSHVRINFDSDLRAGLGSVSIFDPDVPTTHFVHGPNIIMEIKFGHFFPYWIQGLFPDDIRPRLALGKFVLCREQQMCLIGNSIVRLPYAGAKEMLLQGKECVD
jgi:hypothetical protein